MNTQTVIADLTLAIRSRLYTGLDTSRSHWIEDSCLADFNDALRRADTPEEQLAVCYRYNRAFKQERTPYEF